MSESIHGHAVMEMMLEQGLAYSRESLREAIVTRFGADARFHTCSAQDLDPAGIVDFLERKGKFVAAGDGFNTTANHICAH